MDRHMLKALESRYGYDRDVHETTLLATVAKPNVCLDRSGQRPAPSLSRPGSTGRDGFAAGRWWRRTPKDRRVVLMGRSVSDDGLGRVEVHRVHRMTDVLELDDRVVLAAHAGPGDADHLAGDRFENRPEVLA